MQLYDIVQHIYTIECCYIFYLYSVHLNSTGLKQKSFLSMAETLLLLFFTISFIVQRNLIHFHFFYLRYV